MHRIIITIAVLFISACTSRTDKAWDEWSRWAYDSKGKPYKQVVRDLGPPDKVSHLSTGEKVIAYKNTATDSGTSHNCRVLVYVDSEETVSRIRIDGPAGACIGILHQNQLAP